jgi:hypothetical protein
MSWYLTGEVKPELAISKQANFLPGSGFFTQRLTNLCLCDIDNGGDQCPPNTSECSAVAASESDLTETSTADERFVFLILVYQSKLRVKSFMPIERSDLTKQNMEYGFVRCCSCKTCIGDLRIEMTISRARCRSGHCSCQIQFRILFTKGTSRHPK